MDMTAENAKDARMLKLLDLGMLDVALAGNNESGVSEIGASNTELLELTDRFAKLAEDRLRLTNHAVWLDSDKAGIAAHRSSVERESWDLLLAMRKFLLDRRALLVRLEAVADERAAMLSRQHEEIRDQTCKSLDKERRKMVAASPATGNWHFGELVDNNEEVEAALQAFALAKATFDAIVDARRKADVDLGTVNARQREVFTLIAA
jgi:hypothetical protein